MTNHEQCVTKLNYLRSIIVMNCDIETENKNLSESNNDKKEEQWKLGSTKGEGKLKQKRNKLRMSMRNMNESFFVCVSLNWHLQCFV